MKKFLTRLIDAIKLFLQKKFPKRKLHPILLTSEDKKKIADGKKLAEHLRKQYAAMADWKRAIEAGYGNPRSNAKIAMLNPIFMPPKSLHKISYISQMKAAKKRRTV